MLDSSGFVNDEDFDPMQGALDASGIPHADEPAFVNDDSFLASAGPLGTPGPGHCEQEDLEAEIHSDEKRAVQQLITAALNSQVGPVDVSLATTSHTPLGGTERIPEIQHTLHIGTARIAAGNTMSSVLEAMMSVFGAALQELASSHSALQGKHEYAERRLLRLKDADAALMQADIARAQAEWDAKNPPRAGFQRISVITQDGYYARIEFADADVAKLVTAGLDPKARLTDTAIQAVLDAKTSPSAPQG